MNEAEDGSEATLETGGPLVSLRDALASLAPYCREIAPVGLAVEEALGRIAAAEVRAPAAVPAHATALMDGWAVASQETLGASPYAPCFPGLAPVRVRLGDRLPDFADAVLALHAVAGEEIPAQILSPAAPGEGARAKGGDFAMGELIVAAGGRLKPTDLGLLRTAGVERMSLRIPTLRLLFSGREETSFAALADREGAICRIEAMDLSDADHLALAIARADADLVVVIGADSGERVAEVLSQYGALLAPGVAVRPGALIGCGVIGRGAPTDEAVLPVIFAPERFDCALAAWLLLTRPCLRLLSGMKEAEAGESLPLARKIVSSPGLSDLVLLRRTLGVGGSRLWEPLATGDLPFSAIARADAWLLVELESEGYAAGQSVFAQFL
ncbi:hypothetical protein [Methylocapsa acidiphila]|uniref:hypothetical protein n=1 Tax=Methylocapsa acidiphila TaxID=133552 RepID=UPI0018DDD8B6|nr:hypothetical protein [Methylocapsa acidiphila]